MKKKEIAKKLKDTKCNGWGGKQVGEKCTNPHCEYHKKQRLQNK